MKEIQFISYNIIVSIPDEELEEFYKYLDKLEVIINDSYQNSNEPNKTIINIACLTLYELELIKSKIEKEQSENVK